MNDSFPLSQLAEIQRWLQNQITHPSSTRSPVDGNESPTIPVERVILPSRQLSAEQRLEIYHSAYFARLLETMRAFFPTLTAVMGEETFDAFSFQYLQQFPPQSYTLNRLADRFVEFLETTRPPSDEWSDLIIDLARLEHVIDTVFDGPGIETAETLTATALQSIASDGRHRAKLVLAPCLRLLEFRFHINEIFSAHRQGVELSLPAPSATWLAVHRRDYVVRRYPLSQDQFRLLNLLQEGLALGAACESVAAQTDDFENYVKMIGEWFRTWAVEQFFVAVRMEE